MASPGPMIARRDLDEVPDDLVGEDEAGLLVAVAAVVDAGAEDLPRVGERREDAVDRDRVARSAAAAARSRPRSPSRMSDSVSA